MKLIEGIDYYIYKLNFDNRANPAIVVVNDDGTFSIYLNTLCTLDEQLEAIDHEFRHLVLDHFYEETNIEQIENEADDDILLPLHPPAGTIACFHSPDAFSRWFDKLCKVKGIRI